MRVQVWQVEMESNLIALHVCTFNHVDVTACKIPFQNDDGAASKIVPFKW